MHQVTRSSITIDHLPHHYPKHYLSFPSCLFSESDSDSSSCERNYEDKRHHVNQKTASVTLSSEQQPLSPPPRMLTELEMNQLGAKILKAEIMGNKVRYAFSLQD